MQVDPDCPLCPAKRDPAIGHAYEYTYAINGAVNPPAPPKCMYTASGEYKCVGGSTPAIGARAPTTDDAAVIAEIPAPILDRSASRIEGPPIPALPSRCVP